MPSGQEYLAIIGQFAPLVILIVVFYFLLIRPQRKRDKAEREMRNSIEVGDEISTIGGFIGRCADYRKFERPHQAQDLPLGDPRQGGAGDRNGRGPQGSEQGRQVISQYLAEYDRVSIIRREDAQ